MKTKFRLFIVAAVIGSMTGTSPEAQRRAHHR